MAQPFNPACFFSFLLPLMAAFYFVHGEAKFLSNCTKEFPCGAFGFMDFPFAKHTEAHCGLVAVKCDTTPPIVQLGTGGDWYPLLLVKSFGSDYTIAIGDPKLQRPFESRNYSNLNYTIHFQSSPSITFLNLDASILNNFFKCNDTQGGIRNYERYNCTGVFTFYYKRRLPENPKCHAVNCTLYPSPIIIQQTNGGLTAQFVLSLGVSKTCQDCYQGGGQCTEDSENVFHCAQVSGALALLILLSFAIFVAWRSKKGSKGYSRYKSSDPASDLEIGRSRLFGILVFSYSELEEATSKFDHSKELGDGAFGTVYYEEEAVMALPYIPCFSFLFPFVAFYFAHGKGESLSNCPKGFPCGNLGPLEFPFAHHTNPHCGLISVDCDAKPLAKLQLETGGVWYQIVSISWDDSTITLEDSKLQTLFRNRNCSISNYSVKFPNSPSITFDNLEGNKLLHKYIKCKQSQGDHICDYESINCVDGFSLYHKRQLVSENRKCDSANCTLYPTPIVVEHTSDLLTTQFGLQFEVSPACCHCYNGGGQCTSDSKNEFQCAKVFGGLALILVSLALFVVWRRKKGSKGYSRNTSSGPISDPERGQSRFFGILVFSYSELEEATNNFDPSKELGDGGFSTVYYGGASKSNALDMGWSFTCRWCDFDACCSYQEQLLKSPELAIVFLLYGICNRIMTGSNPQPFI
nr:LEAF RUST 10 DISEASE-RESISTANCE LOCUS RECEPTOR-LIKE PROTEIN KINASE-like 1.1 [Ipomoea batatas]